MKTHAVARVLAQLGAPSVVILAFGLSTPGHATPVVKAATGLSYQYQPPTPTPTPTLTEIAAPTKSVQVTPKQTTTLPGAQVQAPSSALHPLLLISSPTPYDPYTSTGGSLNIAGACTPGHTILLDVGPYQSNVLESTSNQSTVCTSSGAFTFQPINKTGFGTYHFSVIAENPASGNTAPLKTVAVTWVRKRPLTVVNLPVVFTNLTVTSPLPYNPYVSAASSMTVAGSCSGIAEVNLAATGQTSAVNNQSVACAGGSYKFQAIAQSVPGTYTYDVFANDAHGNLLKKIAVTWQKEKPLTVVHLPITFTSLSITSPVPYDPYVSATSSMTIAGTCAGVSEVDLAATGQTSTANNASVPCASGNYKFPAIYASTSGTYTYVVFANDAHGNLVRKIPVTWRYAPHPGSGAN